MLDIPFTAPRTDSYIYRIKQKGKITNSSELKLLPEKNDQRSPIILGMQLQTSVDCLSQHCAVGQRH